jgi:hypothetical protein
MALLKSIDMNKQIDAMFFLKAGLTTVVTENERAQVLRKQDRDSAVFRVDALVMRFFLFFPVLGFCRKCIMKV